MQTTESNRSTITCVVMVLFSLVSLTSGVRGGAIEQSIKTAVGVAMTPFLTAIDAVEDGASYVSGYFWEYDEIRNSLDEMDLKLVDSQKNIATIYELSDENDRLRSMLEFKRESTPYELHPAEVLQHSQGVLTIDLGSRDGVRESMCVITAEGIIGMVTDVGPFTSSVITLQNADCRVDAMIAETRVRGQVQGTGNALSSICEMQYIDLNDDVKVGYLVVTSPDSVFPSDFPIGRVYGEPTEGVLSQSVKIMPSANPFSVDEVFVLFRADIPVKNYANAPLNEEIDPSTDELMDIATIQERYAP